MAPNVLITGVSGYIGGSLLTSLLSAKTIPPSNIWGAVRSDAQADKLHVLNVNVARGSLTDEDAMRRVVLDNQIDIVIHTASAGDYALAGPLLKALASRKEETKKAVHFIHTSGASAFADKSGWSHGLVKETDDIYELQRQTTAPNIVRQTDVSIHEPADELGINVYTVFPPLVYGKGTGSWNTISIQIPTLIRVAIAKKQVYRFSENTQWPALHICDLAEYYASLTRRIIEGLPAKSNKHGYYLPASHTFKWHEVLEALGEELYSRNLVTSPEPIVWPSDEFSADALGIPRPFHHIPWNSNSHVLSGHNEELGWQPQWDYKRFLQDMGKEIDTVQESAVRGKTVSGHLGH